MTQQQSKKQQERSQAVAGRLGIDEIRADVMPADKARNIKQNLFFAMTASSLSVVLNALRLRKMKI